MLPVQLEKTKTGWKVYRLVISPLEGIAKPILIGRLTKAKDGWRAYDPERKQLGDVWAGKWFALAAILETEGVEF